MRASARIGALVAAAVLLGVTPGAAGAAAPPTAYLAPLQAHQSKLSSLRTEIDRLRGLPAPVTSEAARERAAEISRAGKNYLVEARAFAKTLNGFIAGGTRRGLDVEVDTIRATIRQVLATVDAYRVLSGGTIEKPTARTPSLLAQELRSALGAEIARRIPNKLLAEGVQRMISGASFRTVLHETLDQVRQNLYAAVDSEVRSVTGLGLRDFRDLGRAIRLRANQEIDRAFTRVLVGATGSALTIELVRRFVLPWLKAQLTQLMRPHHSLNRRVADSIKSLENARRALNALPSNAKLSTVHARWQDARAALAATHFLVADLKRHHRESLLAGDYGEALTEVERAMGQVEVRFLVHKEDLVQTLAVDRNELHGLLNDLGNLAGHVVVPATKGPTTLEAELESGSWTFGRVNGAVLCTITFSKKLGRYGAHILEACHPNESYWKLIGRVLYFFHADGTRTSRLSRVNANYWQGPYLGAPGMPANGTIHYIRR